MTLVEGGRGPEVLLSWLHLATSSGLYRRLTAPAYVLGHDAAAHAWLTLWCPELAPRDAGQSCAGIP